MDRNHGEESASLVVVVDGEGTPSEVLPAKNHTRDVHILSFAFFFIFCAYGAAQNLESTVNSEGDLGTMSLGILYTSFTLFSVVASPIVRGLGTKRALVIGTSGYTLFIASNLKPSWYTMLPASLYLGFTASLIWVSQGTYLTSAACSHARDRRLQEGTVIGDFNGEFWGIFASTNVVGNLVSLFLLKEGKEGDSSADTSLLFTVFLGSMVVGTILMCLLSTRDDKWEGHPTSFSVGSILKSIIAPLLETRMLLIIPLLAYSGLQQSFVWAEFTKTIVKPALGVSGVAGAMAVYGAADAICSLVAGRLTSDLASVTLIVCGGAFLQSIVLFWLLFGYSLSSGILGSIYPLVMAVLLGVGNGVFNTQLNALLGILFTSDTEAAFAQLKIWQSGAIAVIFFLSPYISLQVMLITMVAALCVALSGFLYLTFHVEKSFSSAS